MATSAPTSRFVELDALRGMAAIGVMLFHFFLFWKWVGPPLPGWAVAIADWSPLRVVLTGKTTIFFFVLSGLVLTFPYFAGKAPAYRDFLVKRVLRIYTPYLLGVVAALVLMTLAAHLGGTPPPAKTFGGMWGAPITWDRVLSHVLLVGSYDVYAYNAVIWSLVHEMRISLAIPLIVWAVYRLSWRASLAAGLGLALAGNALHVVFHSPNLAPYKTLPIVIMFVVGALLSRHLRPILAWYRALPRGRKVGFSLAALLAYVYGGLVLRGATEWAFTHGPVPLKLPPHLLELPGDWATIAGVAGLIVTALGSWRVSAAMRVGALRKLGEIPYGIYLYHLPILFFLYETAGATVPLPALYLATLALTVGLARLARTYVELPAADLAYRLTKRRKAVPPVAAEAA